MQKPEGDGIAGFTPDDYESSECTYEIIQELASSYRFGPSFWGLKLE